MAIMAGMAIAIDISNKESGKGHLARQLECMKNPVGFAFTITCFEHVTR
jgi:hypothetical protein